MARNTEPTRSRGRRSVEDPSLDALRRHRGYRLMLIGARMAFVSIGSVMTTVAIFGEPSAQYLWVLRMTVMLPAAGGVLMLYGGYIAHDLFMRQIGALSDLYVGSQEGSRFYGFIAQFWKDFLTYRWKKEGRWGE